MRDNRQGHKPSRRAIVAALAAGAAATVPAIANAATDDDHPDRELLKLGRRYQNLETRRAAADAHLDPCCEAVNSPHRPEALRHRLEDHIFGLQLPMTGTCRTGLCADPASNDFYTSEEIRRLRHAPPPFEV